MITHLAQRLQLALLAGALLLLASILPLYAAESNEDKQHYATLATLLENEALRQQLIADLRLLAEERPTPSMMENAEHQALSLTRQIADITQSLAEDLIDQVITGMNALFSLFAAESNTDWSLIATALLHLGYVVVATLAGFYALRTVLTPFFRTADTWVVHNTMLPPLLMRPLAVLFALLIDLLAVGLAWVAGYSIALLLVGELGEMQATQSLFLNAFLLIEAFKALVRMLFSARFEHLRLLPLCAETAAYWNAWLARLTGFIGYAMLLLVPIINEHLAPALGHFTSLLVMAMAFIYAVTIILQNKLRVSSSIREQAEGSDLAFTSVMLNMLARSWHLLAIAYFAALLLVTMIRPEDALPVMLQASLQTLLAIGVGLFISAVLTQIISRPIHIPDETRARFPALEARLNGFIPSTLKVIRIAIMLIVLAFVLDAWALFNVSAWISSPAGSKLISTALSVAMILLMAKLLWITFASWVEHRLNPNTGQGEPSAREKTLLTLLRNAVLIALSVMTMMITLAEIGINIGPLIAGAGVVGLAIGFGAQTLVKDVITGVFIQLENAIHTGDVVTADGITGTAEHLTIRSLGLRDRFGTYHLIPFSSITSVSNYMRGFGYHVGEYGVAYREDTDEVIVHLRAAFDELMSDEEQRSAIVDDLEVQGVTELGDNAVTIRIRIKTLPGSQWSVGRAYNRLVKRHLDAAGIEIPFPHLTVYFGQDRDGSAPPAPINIVGIPKPAPRGAVPIDPELTRTSHEFGADYDEP